MNKIVAVESDQVDMVIVSMVVVKHVINIFTDCTF